MLKNLMIAALLLLPAPVLAAPSESAFDRVMRTNTLRCGYWNWAPLFSVDTATEQQSGIFYDLMAYIGPAMGLKVEWTKEVGFANFEQDLISGKIDAVCAGVWPKAARGRVMEFSRPVFYVPLNIYVRADDTRFDGNAAALNDPSVTFSGMEGLVEGAVVAQDFPKANRVVVPETSSVSEIFLGVAGKKADAVVADIFTAGSYLANNQGVLRPVKLGKPIRYFGNVIAVNKGEHELVNMLNTALEEAQSAGVIDALITKYEAIPGSLLRVAEPYRQ